MPRKALAQRLPLDEPVLRPTFRRERRALNKGIFPIAGCDEAGRGPLAGPVVAAAVILDPARIPSGLNDSKKLWALARAVKALPVRPRLVFVDGNMKIDCGCDCEAAVSGDALIASIAAASIVAKVTRDRL